MAKSKIKTPKKSKTSVKKQIKTISLEKKSKNREVPLTKKEIVSARKKLEDMRRETLKRIQDKKSMDMPQSEVGDQIDQASQSLDKEILFEVTDNEQLQLEQIESALRRIEKNTYGLCESCRQAISQKRLKALPFARYCIRCQSSTEEPSPAPTE